MTALTLQKALEGLDLIIANAERLYGEAVDLESKKSPTATFLYAIAMEEMGKAFLLGGHIFGILNNEPINWHNFWKNFKSHKFKQGMMFKMARLGQEFLYEFYEEIKQKKPELLADYPNRDDALKKIDRLNAELSKTNEGILEEIKWSSIYSRFDQRSHSWLIPEKFRESIFIKENFQTLLTDVNTFQESLLNRAGIKGRFKLTNEI